MFQSTSTNRRCGGPGLTAIRSFQKVHARGTVLGVALEFVLDVRGRPVLGAAFEDLHRAAAVHASKLSVVILECDRDGLYLPERLVTTSRADAAAFHFTLVKSFSFGCHSGPHLHDSVESCG